MSQSGRRRNWRRALEKLEGAYSPHTIRSYRADFVAFEVWCLKAKRVALPASPRTVAAFFADQQQLAPATLRRRQAAIRKIHRLLRLPNPADDEDVNIALRRAKRMKGTRPRQALGLTKEIRDALTQAAPPTLAGLRDVAMVCVGYDTLCRRAELAALNVEDLTPQKDGTVFVMIRRAKNDPFGHGRASLLSKATSEALGHWLRAAGIEHGALFRSVMSGDHVGETCLDPSSVNRILKRMASQANLSDDVVRGLSGHSMRVGRAQDLMKAGLDILPIMKAGGWKSFNVVGRYVEHVEIGALLRARGVWI